MFAVYQEDIIQKLEAYISNESLGDRTRAIFGMMKNNSPSCPSALFLRPCGDPDGVERPPLDETAKQFLEKLHRERGDDGFAGPLEIEGMAAEMDSIVRLAAMGLLEVRFEEPSGTADPIQGAIDTIELSGRLRPEEWNRIAYEREWALYGDALDVLDPSSPFFAEARFQRDAYLGRFESSLAELPPGSPVLDAGCGVGRFAVELGRRGHTLVCVDRSRGAILRCMRHLAGERLIPSARFWHGGLADLPGSLSGPFRAVLAIELLSYVEDPAALLARLAGLTAPGGLILISVENLHGALLGHPEVPGASIPAILENGIDCRPHHVFARFMRREEVERLIRGAGLDSLWLAPLLYTAGGPLHAAFEALRGTEEGISKLRELERRCEDDPILSPLGRVWCAAARKRPESQ